MHVFRRALAALCLAASLALLLPAITTSATAALILLPLAAIAAWRAAPAAIIATIAAPLATSVLVVNGQGGDWGEMAIVALACGASLRWLIHARPLGLSRLSIPLAVFVVTVVASLAVQLLVLRSVLSAEVFVPELLESVRLYRTEIAGMAHFLHTAAGLLEGVFLVALISDATEDAGEAVVILRCAAAAGAAAAFVNLWRLAGSAARSDHAVAAFFHLVRTVRFSFPYPDVNAAGSYFTLVLLLVAGVAAAASGLARLGWAAAAGLVAVALWSTGSRAAALASLTALILLALRRVERRTAPYAIAALGIAAAAVIWLFPNPILDRSAAGALGIRMEMARVSMRMLRLDPVFGIGIGQFYEQSAAYIRDPAVKAVYVRENAHNNFLQIGAELGVVGLASFAAIIWIAGRAAVLGWRTLNQSVLGAVVGTAAFLVTCLSGHPLLTSEVAATFWIVLASIAAATRLPAAPASHSRTTAALAFVACALVVASVPWRVHRDLATADLEHVGHGVSAWHRDDTGHLYRQMLRDATLFVPRDVVGIELPYRLAQPGPPVTLEFQFRGRTADRVVVQDDEWRVRRVVVPPDPSLPRFAPLTVKIVEGDPATVWLGKVTVIGER